MEEIYGQMAHWKRVYQTVSGLWKQSNIQDIDDILNIVNNQLVNGIGIFRAWRNEEDALWDGFMRDRPDLNRIIRRLAKELDVEISLTWQLFCNYLSYVYHGRPEDIQEVSTNELYMVQFVTKFEHFYSMERMYMLKTMHHILINHDNLANPFQPSYERFLNANTIVILRRSFLNQFHLCHVQIRLDRDNIDSTRIIRCTNELKQICMMMVSSSWGRTRCIEFGAGETGIEVEPQVQVFANYIQAFHFRKYGLLEDDLKKIIGVQALFDFHCAHVAAIIVPFAEFWNNVNLFNSHRESIERVYKECRGENMAQNSLIFVLHWSLILIRNPMVHNQPMNFLQQHRHHIQDTLRQGALRILSTFLNSRIIHEVEEGHRVRMVVYRLFQELYVCVDADDGLYSMPGLVPLLVSLMEDKEIAHMILSGDNEIGLIPTLKLKRIINTVEALFPFDFISYSSILHAMMQLEAYQANTFMTLNDLKTYTEERWPGSVVFITSNFRPLPNDIVIAPAQQEARIMWRNNTDVHVYKTNSYSYFDILQLLMVRYLQGERAMGHRVTNDSYGTAILSGLDLMMDVLAFNSDFESNPTFAACISHVFNIIKHNLEEGQYDHDVIIRCLKVCVKLMDLMPERVLTFLRGMGLLPTIHLDYYARKQALTLETIIVNNRLLNIVSNDVLYKRTDLLDICIDLIQHAIRSGKFYSRVQLPLTVFVFEKIFPIFKLSFKYYCRPGYRIHSVTKIVELLHQILISEPGAAGSIAHKLKEQSLRLLLTHAPLIEQFLYAAVQNTNSMIEAAVCHKTNWANVACLEQMRIARICVSTLLLLIKETGSCADLLKHPFGSALVIVRPNTADHVQILASLINNSFEPELRQAACRLLSKFAQNPALKLLAHLDLDGFQVRSVFLEKLRDPMEENTNKVAVVDLIAASVQSQNALTAAFFNIPKYMADRSADLSDNVSIFIIEHFDNIQRFPELQTSAIHTAVLHLLENVWVRGIELIMVPLLVMDGFWVNLSSSIFEELAPPNDGYLSILNIFTSQVYIAGIYIQRSPEEFLSVLLKMFVPQRNSWILQLLRYIRNCLIQENQADGSLLIATKQFLMETVQQLPEYFEHAEFRGDIAFYCLEGLWEYMKNPVNIEIVESWLMIYNHLIHIWGQTTLTNYESDTGSLVTDIINQFVVNFNHMSKYIKSTMYIIISKIIPQMETTLNQRPQMLKQFLNSIRTVIETSEKAYHLEIQPAGLDPDLSWTMLIVLTGQLFELTCDAEFKNWFIGGTFYKRVMATASKGMTQSDSFQSARYALNALTKYVERDVHGPVTMTELEQFYRLAQPPKEFLVLHPYDPKALRDRTNYEEFWNAYMAMVQYNTALLRKNPRDNFAACLSFFRMHWEVLDAMMKLPSVTVEPTALALVQAILAFGCEMMEQHSAWYRADMGPKMVEDFFVLVRVCINSCIQIIISPNILQFYTRNTLSPLNVETVADEIYVQVIEHILDVFATACNCYNKATPSHVDLLCSDDIKRKLIGSNVIDADISIPKISANLNAKLSYGDLLYVHQILVQILYKVHNKTRPTSISKQTQLIVDPTADAEEEHSTTIDLRRKINKERRVLLQTKRSIRTTPLSSFGRLDVVGLVCPDYVYRGVTDWTTRRVHEPEVSSMSAPWLAMLSEARTLRALESLTTLLGNEIHQHLATYTPRSLEVLFYRRHFSTELRMFHNYVKKWRCGNLSLNEVLSSINYHYARRTVATPHEAHAHRSLVPPCASTSEIDPSLVFSIESPVPNVFNEWRRAAGLTGDSADYFFAPESSDALATPPNEDTAALTNNYLLMLSHWLDYVCNTND